MFIDEACRVVYFVVNNQVQILLPRVGRDLGEGELFGRRHCFCRYNRQTIAAIVKLYAGEQIQSTGLALSLESEVS